MAALYTKTANRQRLAEEAASLLIPEPKRTSIPAPHHQVRGTPLKKKGIQVPRKKVVGEAGLEPAKA